ncbi:similar to Saccharomyces cerevisiae YLR453C RIF2 Protein that binds to the Rap1p C-terminus and acts synergistically with Rif1p to help control telomere length and establish telomeric silencing [Maudiozyma saulgeensis]|uniref:Similar to Saccharomyces cerevisiae YLR453C RIF2 Protein that binds to the Rap1p C-terminus and acts synergistically with Rif1p to help control telomere length and establish telomeric silencing n=1 Tax=Maudiozyma saulgeensis TaxID=1789683 RepID=A0A1X7R6B4_9SACH|nr:similar to Saccharomyces cerevisiae YLR453C RIF2 Protein that binds to the Rap1p C-terminus and acts synergistically with Rif1p to help control telomere length and establish telomeric silencing [Kazachstania saulgeensis]
MNHIDNDFAPIRKSNITVKFDDIIHDVKTNHHQMSILKNISLVYGTKMSQSKRNAIESRRRSSESPLKKKKIDKNLRSDQEKVLSPDLFTNKNKETEVLPPFLEPNFTLKKRNSIKIPLFSTKRYTKTSPKKNTIIKRKQNIPLFSLKNSSNKFVKKLKLDLLNKLSPRSSCSPPSYFSETDKILTKIVDSTLEGAPFDKPIALCGPYSYSYGLFERIFKRECQKYNFQYVKVTLPPLPLENNQNSRYNNCEVLFAKMKIQFPNEMMKESFQGRHHEMFNIRQVMRTLANVINISNQDIEHKYIILFSSTDARYLESSVMRSRWELITNFIVSAKLPAVMVCFDHLIENSPSESTLLENSTVIDVPKLHSLPNFISELSSILYYESTSTSDVEFCKLWNEEMSNYLNNKNSMLYKEVEKIFLSGEGPLNCVKLIVAKIIYCNDLPSVFKMLREDIKHNVQT